MELMTYKTRALRTLSLLILVALIAALNPPSLTDSTAFAQATAPELTASANTANQVDLSWTAVEDADDYELWRWEDTEGWAEIDDSISGTSYSDTGVTAGLTYYYQVSADGGETWSNRVNETVGAYDASTLDAPTATSTAVSLSWSAVTGAASYELWRYETSWTQVGGTLNATSHSDASVEIGKTYFYQVMAKGPDGDGAWSNRVSATVPSTTPGAPQNFSASPSDAQVMLSWDEPVSNGGSAVTGYQYRYQMSGGSWSSWMDTTPALSRTATVSSLTNESAHNFEVQAVNANGTGPAATANATPMSTVPGIPSGLASPSAGPTEIQLSWNAVTGASSYHLQRRTNGGAWGSPIDAGSGTSYTDSDVEPSTTYDYEVRSVNAAGSSEWSSVATVSTTAPTAPEAPALTADASADKITLTWTAPDSNGADITGYDLDVSDDGSDWDDFSSPAAGDTSAEHTALGPGTTKHYRISATNSAGTSDWSATATATVEAVVPGTPTLYANASGTTIVLTWVPPAANGGADITGYTIQVSSSGTTGWNHLATKDEDDASHDHTSLAAGTTRYYQIRATNSVGSGEWSDVASATVGGAAPPPFRADDASSPRSLTVTPVDLVTTARGTSTTSLTLTWIAPTTWPTDNDDTNNDPRTYEAEVWNPTTQTWGTVMNAAANDGDPPVAAEITVTDGTFAGSLSDTGLMGTTDYTYRVRATDGTARGTWSELNNASTGTTVAVSPDAPKLTATKMGADKIVLTWTVSDDGGSDIVGYVLQFGETTSVDQYLNAAGEAGTDSVMLDAVQQSVTHSGLTAGEDYFYQISALNGVAPTDDLTTINAAWSAASEEVSATTDTGAPGAPTLTATGGATQIELGVVNTDTGGAGITFTTHEFQVYDEADDSWTILQDNATASYTHTGLDANVKMYYRARSKNLAHGAGPWSETQSATTNAGAPGAPVLSATVNGPDRITLSWTVPNNGGATITSYTISVSDDGDAFTDANDTNGVGLTGLTGTTLSATHTGLSAGNTRHYRITATNGSGTSTFSNTVMATTTTGGVPGAPEWDDTTPLSATSTSVTLNWDAPQVGAADDTSVTGYDIAMWQDGQWVVIASNIAADPTGYVASELAGATTYYFSVRARNANGGGPWSIVDSIATLAGSPGKMDLTATPDGATKIVLTWTTPDSGGGTITDYLVQVSNNGTIGWAALDSEATNNVTIGTENATRVITPEGAPAPPLTVTHEGLTGLTKRYYRVLASTDPPTTETNRGAWSDVKYATTPAGKPGAPMWPDTGGDLDALVVTASSITLAWVAPASGGSAITGYQIQIWRDGAWTDLMSVGGSVTSYVHDKLPGATTNYYRLRATNAVGDSPWSDTHSGLTANGMPGAPVLHADQNGSSEIRLTWTAPATGGGELSSYQIQVSNDGQSGWTSPATSQTIVDGERVTQTDDADTQNYNHTGLDPATTRYYRVRAVNNVDTATEGPWSNVAMATTTGDTPGRPTLVASASGTSMINLAWTPPTGDGGSAITSYELQYWDGSNGWMALTSTAASVTSHAHRNIDGGTTKYYRIRAMNSGGSGLWSTVAYATTATSAPAPPTLTATADGATKITLTWTAGHDGGMPVTGYNLQHSSDAGRSWAPLGETINVSMMLSRDDTGLTGGATKHYRISATNSVGTSGWSPLASATTARSIPGRPTLTIGELNRALYISWADPATPTGGSAIRVFEVEKWDSANRRWTDLTTTSATAVLDSGLESGKKYFYRVRAVNAMGDGPWSTFAGGTAQ